MNGVIHESSDRPSQLHVVFENIWSKEKKKEKKKLKWSMTVHSVGSLYVFSFHVI